MGRQGSASPQHFSISRPRRMAPARNCASCGRGRERLRRRRGGEGIESFCPSSLTNALRSSRSSRRSAAWSACPPPDSSSRPKRSRSALENAAESATSWRSAAFQPGSGPLRRTPRRRTGRSFPTGVERISGSEVTAPAVHGPAGRAPGCGLLDRFRYLGVAA
jgi:hypothetical protein